MSITQAAAWWRSAVIYQIYPKSWADADGDGIGDIAGIRSRLPYLARLGVDAIWICPWYPSPQADGGYDVADCRAVDPMFGDVAQARVLVQEAHDLGLRVILDIVPNHTSDQHRFFQEALASEPGAPAWDRYHCVRGADDGASPPNDWPSVFGGSAWDPILDRDGAPSGWWYLHLFDAHQPDLNWDSPDVHEEFRETLRFWFQLGVDGFRIDVAAGLVKAAGYPPLGTGGATAPRQPQWDQPGVHDIWREWRRVSNGYAPPRALIGEVWVDTPQAQAAYLRPDELHTAFNFGYLKCPWDGPELRRVIDQSLDEAGLVGAPTTWVLENHDVPRAPTRFGQEAVGAVLGRGPESNLDAPPEVVADLGVGLARARAGLLFMLGLPGSAYLYQGEELGLPEVLDLPASARQDPAFARTGGAQGYRDGSRVPFPWTRAGASFGFSPTGRSWLPQPAGWGALSAQAQAGDPGSTLELTRRALRLRRAEPALGDGDLEWISPVGADCLVARRPAGDTEPHAIIALNLGATVARVEATEVLICSGPALEAVEGGYLLGPDTGAWLR